MNKIVKLMHILYKDNYINEVLNETAEENPQNKLTEVTVVGANDDWDDGLTFTAKSSRKYCICFFFVFEKKIFFFLSFLKN